MILSLAVLAVLIAALGCGPGEEPESLGPGSLPYGEAVFSGPVLLALDHNWGLLPVGGDSQGATPPAAAKEAVQGWSFRGSATFRLRLAEGFAGPLSVHLTPDAETATHPFVARWNGTAIDLEKKDDGSLQVTVPAEALQPGPHVLEVGRKPGSGGRDRLDNIFPRVAYRAGDGPAVDIDPLDRPRHQLLADFLTVSVTGRQKRKYGGLLFSGPGEHPIPLQLPRKGHLHATVENLSVAPATFTLDAGDKPLRLTLAGGAQQPVRIPLAAGRHSLRLTAEMDNGSEGLLLVGELSFEPGAQAQETPAPPADTPVILITLDTTRRDALAAYGGDPRLTPNLSAIAEQATVYERGYATAPWTLPSHASMMTGRYPSHHGAGVSEQFLSADIPTIASILRRRGYFTAGFAGGKLCSHRYGVGQGFLRYRNPQRFESAGDHLTNLALDTVDRHYRKPLFLFINYFDPHAMFRAPDRFEDLTGVDALRQQLEEGSTWSRFDKGDANAWRAIIDGEAPASPEELTWMRAAYDAEVAFMDEQLGRLVQRLKDLGLWEPALVMIVADHGELLGEGGYYSHSGRLDTELMEIPFLVKWPHQQSSRRSDSLVSQVDLLPTVMAVLDIEGPPVDGLPLPEGENSGAETTNGATNGDTHRIGSDGTANSDDRHRYVLMEEHESRVHPLPPALKIAPHTYGVQRPQRRSIVWKGGGECLAGSAWNWSPAPCPEDAQPEAVLAWLYRLLGEPGKAESVGLVSAEEREGLRALGYI